jgi:hypothetical protein
MGNPGILEANDQDLPLDTGVTLDIGAVLDTGVVLDIGAVLNDTTLLVPDESRTIRNLDPEPGVRILEGNK